MLDSDYGADGYATRAQVDEIRCCLDLSSRDTLLDVGSGAGWPGLYLAVRSGCRVVCADLYRPGMQRSVVRARTEGLAGKAWSVQADGRRLPFPDGTFTRVVHTDVLCCLEAKLAVLRECRRVLGGRGQMAFHVIRPAPGLTDEKYRTALGAGPPNVSTRRREYAELLERAGFTVLDWVDLTAEYALVLRAKQDLEKADCAELTSRWGDDLVTEWNLHRARNVTAVEEGLLLRTLCVAAPRDSAQDW